MAGFQRSDVTPMSVTDFYAGKSVFITGGTGFLGKVITEKLLYSCPKIETIYILMREKKNLNVQQRTEKMMESPAFNRLRKERIQDLEKIKPIVGDITADNLGIKKEDEDILIKKVSVVIHSAATVRFNESLKTAFNINLEGTLNVLNLARRMKNIQIVVHVSTPYCNTIDSDVIEEKLYPTPIPVEEAKEYISLHGDDHTKMTEFLFGRPNTYTFTKALAEIAVEENRGNVPVIIVRPSIITASLLEPQPGWVENFNAATGILYIIGKGFCRSLFGDRNGTLDIIPVDYVSNFILVAAAICHGCKEVKVLNCCSSSTNPISMGDLADQFIENYAGNGYNDIPMPFCYMTQRRWLFRIIIFFLEILPAYFADFCLYVLGRPTKFIKLQVQVSQIRNVLEYFTTNFWNIKTSKSLQVISQLSKEDSITFLCNPEGIRWKNYLTVYSEGVRKFLDKGNH